MNLLSSSLPVDGRIREILVRNIVEGGRPISICEDPLFYETLQAGADIRSYQYRKVRKEEKEIQAARLDTNSHRVPRNVIVKDVDEYCGKVIGEFREHVLQQAKTFGCTQLSDGRSNIMNDSLLVVGCVTGNLFCPLGVLNAGTNKKDADYLAGISKKYLLEDVDLAAHTFASVSDGARACLNALDILQEDEFIVPIRCQSHAMSLFLKAVAKGPFHVMINKADDLVSWIRGRPRIHSLVRQLSTRSVFRFVEVRFATHVIGCRRLLMLWPHLWVLVGHESYTTYRDGLSNSEKLQFEKMEELIRDTSFWEEMRDFCTVTVPATVALRLMDMSITRAKHVNAIWTALGQHLVTAFSNCKNIDNQRKLEVYRAFEKARNSAHRPVFDAAWVLDPANLGRIRQLATSTINDSDIQEWARLRKNTIDVLSLTARRKVLTERRAAKAQQTKVARLDPEANACDHVDDAEFRSESDRLVGELRDEFSNYYANRKPYTNWTLRTENDWVDIDGKLKFFAVRILNMACTISDVERLHKCYAHVHTASRNRLKLDRADRLTNARFICRLKRTTKIAKEDINISLIESFTTLSISDDEALYQWGEMLEEAITRTTQSIAAPSEDDISVQYSAQGTSEPEASEQPMATNVDTTSIEVTESDNEEEPIGTGPALPLGLREAGLTLGMYGHHM